jgi:hypothetical protein
MRSALAICLLGACVRGNPQPDDPSFTDTGGTIAIDGCGYSVTSRIGAEAPRVGNPASIGPDPTPRLVHLGLVGDARTSIVVQWRTVDEETRATAIRFAEGADLSEGALTETGTGIEFAYKSTGSEIYRMHQAHLCGLKANTSYSYQVGSPGYFSPVYTFRTAPDVSAEPDAEVVFAFLGDSRGGYDIWEQLVQLTLQRKPDLVLFSGDAVTIGLTQFEWEEFFGRAEPLFATVPVISAHGNHDVNSVNYYSQFALPGDQQNFGLDYGHAHITVANDTPEDIASITGAFRAAIQADFEASKDARWKLLMHHQPIWSASTRHGSSTLLKDAWNPLIDQYKIDLVLNGHDHDYEVTKPLFGGQVQASNADGTVFVVAGGAGAELYDAGNEFWTQYAEKTYSAAILRVGRDALTMDAFRQDNTAIPTGFAKTK